MKKKILALCLVVVLAATAVIGGTLAYFTDTTGTVVNTFSVGKVDIKLDEAKTVPGGDYETNHDNRTETGNAYKLVPGTGYRKDPTVTVLKDSEPSYVRMIITVHGGSGLLTANDFWYGDDQGKPGFDPAWTVTKISENVYEARYNELVQATTGDVVLPELFSGFIVPLEFGHDEMVALNGVQMDIVAHAIQMAGFGTADAAWAAFDAEAAN